MIKARAARLREAAAARRPRWLQSLVGSAQQILVERPGDRGHAGNFAEVRLSPTPFAMSLSKGCTSSSPQEKGQDSASTSSTRTVGEIVAVTITGVDDGKLIGVAA
jgi:threonylcarbamoyladenosine tRNA methylthiotransferase MtaB